MLLLGNSAVPWRRCGFLHGDWAVDDDGWFVGRLFAGSDACFPPSGGLQAAWLTAATSFRIAPSGPVLLDADGRADTAVLASAPPQVVHLTPPARCG